MRETHEPNLTVHVTPAGSAYCIYETGPTIRHQNQCKRCPDGRTKMFEKGFAVKSAAGMSFSVISSFLPFCCRGWVAVCITEAYRHPVEVMLIR
jgi:hypothetical protein